MSSSLRVATIRWHLTSFLLPLKNRSPSARKNNQKLNKDNIAGLYITVIFHLTVIIVLLGIGIDSTLKKEESFVLDFSKQEEIEKQEQQEREFIFV